MPAFVLSSGGKRRVNVSGFAAAKPLFKDYGTKKIIWAVHSPAN